MQDEFWSRRASGCCKHFDDTVEFTGSVNVEVRTRYLESGRIGQDKGNDSNLVKGLWGNGNGTDEQRKGKGIFAGGTGS